jgi:carbonic anhydrase
MKNQSNRLLLLLTAAIAIAAGCQSPKPAQHSCGATSAPACCSMPAATCPMSAKTCPTPTATCPMAGMACTTNAAAVPPTKESQTAMTPQSALAELKTGNARFVAGHPLVRNQSADVKATASGQYPFAVVLSCLDSRQPIEIVLDQGIGDIFSARVAGNVLNDDILGSLEFACKVSGAKLIAVIGHSNCGAIKGAVDGVDLGNLTGLLGKIQPAIGQVPAEFQPRTSKNHEFVDKVSEANVRLVMQQIRERSPILREMLDSGQIGLVGGMYDLSTGEVHFYSNSDK